MRLFLGSVDLEALMGSLNIGPNVEEHDHGHNHDGHVHAYQDHRGLSQRKRSSHEYHEGHEGNTTWDQVPTHRQKQKKHYFTYMSNIEVNLS